LAPNDSPTFLDARAELASSERVDAGGKVDLNEWMTHRNGDGLASPSLKSSPMTSKFTLEAMG
jgi:hypothetical protein